MTDWEDLTQEEKLDQLHDDLEDLESRVQTIGQTYVGVDKLREDLNALKRVIGRIGFIDYQDGEE